MADSKKILVADDEPDLREALVTMLEVEGFSVLSASDGEEALALIIKERPDLILLDIHMPKKDGIDVLREVRANTETAHTHVIMLTATGDMQSVSQALEHGGVNFEYLIKTDWKLTDVAARVHEKLNA